MEWNLEKFRASDLEGEWRWKTMDENRTAKSEYDWRDASGKI